MSRRAKKQDLKHGDLPRCPGVGCLNARTESRFYGLCPPHVRGVDAWAADILLGHTEGRDERIAERATLRDMELWKVKGNAPSDFDQEGGIGFNPHMAPHENCPDCMGEGTIHTIVKDTRFLSPAAVALYAGIKQTKDGIEVKMHPKTDALEKLAQAQ